eukprot:355041-Chlamydomonas_euryale.AAC.15
MRARLCFQRRRGGKGGGWSRVDLPCALLPDRCHAFRDRRVCAHWTQHACAITCNHAASSNAPPHACVARPSPDWLHSQGISPEYANVLQIGEVLRQCEAGVQTSRRACGV